MVSDKICAFWCSVPLYTGCYLYTKHLYWPSYIFLKLHQKHIYVHYCKLMTLVVVVVAVAVAVVVGGGGGAVGVVVAAVVVVVGGGGGGAVVVVVVVVVAVVVLMVFVVFVVFLSLFLLLLLFLFLLLLKQNHISEIHLLNTCLRIQDPTDTILTPQIGCRHDYSGYGPQKLNPEILWIRSVFRFFF